MDTHKDKKNASALTVSTILSERLSGNPEFPFQCGPRYTLAVPLPLEWQEGEAGRQRTALAYPVQERPEGLNTIVQPWGGHEIRNESGVGNPICIFKNSNSILIIPCYNLWANCYTHIPLPPSQTEVLNHHQSYMDPVPSSQHWPLLQRILLIEQNSPRASVLTTRRNWCFHRLNERSSWLDDDSARQLQWTKEVQASTRCLWPWEHRSCFYQESLPSYTPLGGGQPTGKPHLPPPGGAPKRWFSINSHREKNDPISSSVAPQKTTLSCLRFLQQPKVNEHIHLAC